MIDIFSLTPEQLDKFISIQAQIARQEEDAGKVRAARDYYRGEHPTMLTQRQEEFLGRALTQGDYGFAHNLIKSVIDTLRERLDITGFTVNGEAAGEDSPEGQLAALLWEWFKHSKMPSQQIRLWRRALRDGKTYLMVDYDNAHGRPRFTLHEVDDGTTGVSMRRDPSDENYVLFASRYFQDLDPVRMIEGSTINSTVARRTVYMAHEIRKYRRQGIASGLGFITGWERITDPDDAGVWPLPWVDRQGQPLGVPLVEFANPGGSEVAQIAGLQNSLNKTWLDLIAAADASGFPLITFNYRDGKPMPLGLIDDSNLDGEDETIIAPGRGLEIFGGTIDRIEGANLDHMIQLIWTITAAIGGITRTPQYYLKPILGVDVPSGEALKQLESGLVAKAEERQLVFGEAMADAMSLAYRVALTFGPGGIPVIDDPVIGVQWADASTRMEETESKIAETHKALGVPDVAVWARLGYSPEQIQRFQQAKELAQATMIANIAAAAQQPGAGA
jgi:hypothetical protein